MINLKKIIYAFGVYKLCVGIHRTFICFPDIVACATENAKKIVKSCQKFHDATEGKETCEIGIKPNHEVHFKPMNKIGF